MVSSLQEQLIATPTKNSFQVCISKMVHLCFSNKAQLSTASHVLAITFHSIFFNSNSALEQLTGSHA